MPRFALISALVFAASTVAAPAHAQPAAQAEDYRPRTDVLIKNLNQLRGAIAAARKNGTVTAGEAETLRGEVHGTRQAIATHSRDGLTRTEFQELAQRVNAIRTKLRLERMDFERPPA